MYIGVMTGCKEVTAIYEKDSSREDLAKFHTIAKALNEKTEISSDKNLERLLRSLLFTTTELCSVWYNNSSTDQLTQIEQEHLHVAINREDYSDHEAEI